MIRAFIALAFLLPVSCLRVSPPLRRVCSRCASTLKMAEGVDLAEGVDRAEIMLPSGDPHITVEFSPDVRASPRMGPRLYRLGHTRGVETLALGHTRGVESLALGHTRGVESLAMHARAHQVLCLDVNVTCESEEAASYTKKKNRMYLITDAVQDPKVVRLRCPAPNCMLRIHSYDRGFAHYENFTRGHYSLTKNMKGATFGPDNHQYYDIQMQLGAEGSFIAAELLRQVANFNIELKPPGEVGGEDARSYLRTSTDDVQVDSMRQADVAYFPAEQWEKASQCYAEFGGELPFGVAVPTFVIESRSISQTRAQMRETMQVWMMAGVKEAWLVDPIVISYEQWLPWFNGDRECVFIESPTFGQVDVYVLDPATGNYKITTFERPESVQSETGLPDFVMDFTGIWKTAMQKSAKYFKIDGQLESRTSSALRGLF